jgi:iron complex outermembrane receptor protein
MKRFQPNPLRIVSALIIFLTFFLTPAQLFAQQGRGTVKGKVVTKTQQPADNVSIGLLGTRYGAVTNDAGEFAFRAPAGNYTLIISYVGVQTVEVPVTVTTDQTVNVPLITINASIGQLSEVNVIANKANRFTRKISTDVAKIPLNNLENAQSYSVVTNELLKEQNVFNVEDALKMLQAFRRCGMQPAVPVMAAVILPCVVLLLKHVYVMALQAWLQAVSMLLISKKSK